MRIPSCWNLRGGRPAARAWLGAGLLLLGAAASVFAVERFPRPEFESGHELPVPTVPGPRPQWLEWTDVAVLGVALGLAAYLVLKRRSRRWIVALVVFALLYFGFFRHGCVCAVGSVQNVGLCFFDDGYTIPLTVIAFFALPIVAALFFGRVFCAAVCPLGAIQDLVVFKPVRVPAWLEGSLGMLRYVVLGLAMLLVFIGAGFIICRFDPFVGFFRFSAAVPLLIVGGCLLLIGLFVARPYCRYLCPYGLVLGWMSVLSRRHATITPDECIQCRLCEDACPFGAIRRPTPARAPESRAAGIRRLVVVLIAVPCLAIGAAWLVAQLDVVLARAHPTFRLAEQVYGDALRGTRRDTLRATTFRGTGQPVDELLRQGLEIRERARLGGWFLGAFLGAAVGVRLVALSVRRTRRGYEPDRATCLSCARCFRYCPREHVRMEKQRMGGGREPEPAV